MKDLTHVGTIGPYDSPEEFLEATGMRCVFAAVDVKAVRATAHLPHKLDRNKDAARVLRTAIDADPLDPQNQVMLGDILSGAFGAEEQAINAYRAALELDPGSRAARVGLTEALATWRRGLKLDPEFPDAHRRVAIILEETGQADEAETFCQIGSR